MTNPFRHIIERIRRIPPSRGFGIQSPWAYHTMTDAITPTRQSDECRRLAARYPQQSKSSRRRHELLYRLALRLQADAFIDSTGDPIAPSYASAGSQKIAQSASDGRQDGEKEAAIIYHCHINSPDIVRMAAAASPKSMLIIDGIRDDKSSFRRWEEFRDSAACGITFDLYGLALAFLDRRIIKQHYKGPCF